MKKIYLLLTIVLCTGMAAQPAGWLYNQLITVSNPNAVPAVNYQLKLTVNTQSLISAGKMLANGNDIRFGTTCSGTVFLNYWIEGGLNTTTTTIWVKVPLVAANSSTVIFMFFGNSGATPMSAIVGTFRGPNSATDSVVGGTSGGMLVCQRGFRFSPNQNMLVTHFGKNEPTGSTRYVTLFNYTSQAILSQTQVSGPAATYSYGPISSPLWLTAGTQYVLQIYGLASDGYYYQSSSQIGQHLTYYDMQYSNGGTQNTFPNSTLANYHYGYGDFWYFIATTLAIAPTYTVGGSLISIFPSSNGVCAGNSITLTTNASGTYSWNTGATTSSILVSPSVTTTYSVVESNTVGCSSYAILTVTVNNTVPSLTVTSSANTVCPTNTVILTASGALSYTWSGGITNGQAFSPLTTTNYTVSGQNGCGTSTAVATITVTPLPVIGVSSPTIVCSGNSATLSAGGATNYTWTPGNLVGSSVLISPFSSTTYTVIGTSGVCAGIYTLAVPVNPNPTLSANTTASMTCSGDTVTLTATGALSYTWQPGGSTGSSIVVSPLTPTGYNVVGTNSFGCTSNANVAVIAMPGPTLIAAVSPSQICVGASATLSASGANTYSWSTGSSSNSLVVNPSNTTVYSVVGTNTNSGCSATQTLNLSVFVATISVTSPTAICLGSSVTINASGATSYTWNTGSNAASILVSPGASTSYSVFGQSTLNGMTCSSTGSTAVTVNPLPVVTATSTRTTICKGETVTIVAGGASTYVWNTSATSQSLAVNPQVTTNYSVIGTNSNNCVNTASIQIKVTACTVLFENSAFEALQLEIYPNPSSGEFNIKSVSSCNLFLVNELGQVVRYIELNASNQYIFKVNGLSRGIYFIQNATDKKQSGYKVMVEN